MALAARPGFRKTSKLDVLATMSGREVLASPDKKGWRKSASSRGVSHFAQANETSVQAILEAVGDKYFISKDPADYIFAVYRAVTEDEPNGNGDAFPREELLSWNKYEKKPVYRTFEFKPRFVNHQADDLRMARGVCLDAHYNENDPEDRFIEVLVCYDAKKDPILAQAVLDGLISQCSMGCDALKTVCNVCDNIAWSEDDYCKHILPANRMKEHRAPDGKMKLAFERCYEVTFQELSDVDDPADKKAGIQEVMAVQDLSAKIASESGMLSLVARVKRLESNTATEPSFQMAASLGAQMSVQAAAAKKTPEVPEHHAVCACYAKQHDLAFGDSHKAMQACMKETGKSEQEIKACWDKKMAEDAPHPKHEAICASLNAQLQACGDMKKAIKRAAEDHDIDHETVGKCAEHMKHSNKMPQAKAAEAPAAAAPAAEPAAAAAEPVAAAHPGAPTAPAHDGSKDGDGPPAAAVEKKIEDSAKTAAAKLAGDAPADEAAKQAAADKEKADKEKEAAAKAAQAAPIAAAPPAADPAAVVQAADAPADKTLGDMGVKTGTEDDKAKEAAAVAAKKADDDKQKEAAKKAADEKEEKEKEARVASQFPFAKYYQDVTAKKVASGDIHVSRAGKLMFTVLAAKKITAKDALAEVASFGLVAAMKKLSSMSKTADLGVGEGAISDAVGGRPTPPQSVTDGAMSDGKDKSHTVPASATAEGANTDMVDKTKTKDIGNGDVRDGATTDNKGGVAPSADSMVDKGENTDAKDKHPSKNVGKDNVLAGHQVDFVTAGLDPKTAALVRQRLAQMPGDEKEKEAAKKAADEKDKAEKEAKKASDDAKEVEKKATILAHAKMAKFKRGLRLAARRFALNIEPCYLKHSLGEVLSTRHEASGYMGMDQDLTIDIVGRGLSLSASLEHVDHMVKRATELAAMPEDSLAAVEADAEKLEPVHPHSAQAEQEPSEHEARSASLRRRASSGSLPALRASEVLPPATEMPSKQALLRQAIGGGILGSKYPGRQ